MDSERRSEFTEPIDAETASIATVQTSTSAESNHRKPKANSQKTDNKKNRRSVLTSFSIYETRTRYYIIGSNANDSRFRIIKIDRTIAPQSPSDDPYSGLTVIDQGVVYTKKEMEEILKMIDVGNRSAKIGASGSGLKKICVAHGIIGFIRFLEGYYLLVITKRSPVALIGSHYVYHIDDTMLINIANASVVRIEKKSDETRYVTIFQTINLNKNFYFSYTYDITRTLQINIVSTSSCRLCRYPPGQSSFPRTDVFPSPGCFGFNDQFVWNHHLLKAGIHSLVSNSPELFPGMNVSDENLREADFRASPVGDWILPIIHGFVDQAKISIFGQPIYVTLIGRRSRHYAGARFHKRGVNKRGFVANEVETEQILHNASITHQPEDEGNMQNGVCEWCGGHGIMPGGYLCGNRKRKTAARFTSFVQLRGSIPLHWSQDTSNMAPKPPIELVKRDPYFRAAAKHFDSVFQRYGLPVIILNLIKTKERHRRESLLGDEFHDAIKYLNQFLPERWQIRYIAWDMAKASKSHEQDVFAILENYANEILTATGIFQSAPEPWTNTTARRQKCQFPSERVTGRRQLGIVRTNCIDCLDRTNAAQFCIGKCAFAHQLYALGVIPDLYVPFDCDAMSMLSEMYDDQGDTLALQYGGSHLVNTMDTYRKTNAWTSHSRDMIESIKRYYSNSFTDAEKQDAINLILGNYAPLPGQPTLWDLPSDSHLHNGGPSYRRMRRSYVQWWTPDHLALTYPDGNPEKGGRHHWDSSERPDRFREYYQPHILTSVAGLFAYKMMSTLRVAPSRQSLSGDYSPFRVRASHAGLHGSQSRSSQALLRSVSKPILKRMVVHDAGPSAQSSKESTSRAYWWLSDIKSSDCELGRYSAMGSSSLVIGSWAAKDSSAVLRSLRSLRAGMHCESGSPDNVEGESSCPPAHLVMRLEFTRGQSTPPYLGFEADKQHAIHISRDARAFRLESSFGDLVVAGFPSFECLSTKKRTKPQVDKPESKAVAWSPRETSTKKTLKVLVERLTHPSVPAPEEKEYRRYVHQFGPLDHIALIPSTPSTVLTLDGRLDTDLSRPEYGFYQSTVRKGRSGGQLHDHARLAVHPVDVQMYSGYCQLARKSELSSTSSADVDFHRTGEGLDRAHVARRRYEAYTCWLKTGRFGHGRTKPRPTTGMNESSKLSVITESEIGSTNAGIGTGSSQLLGRQRPTYQVTQDEPPSVHELEGNKLQK